MSRPTRARDLKSWMAAHNAAIMAVLCLVIGAKLVGDAITGLSRSAPGDGVVDGERA